MNKYFLEIHSWNHREWPWSDFYTSKAYNIAKDYISDNPKILDIWCGPWEQTLCLSKETNWSIIALDYYPQYLEQLKDSIKKRKISNINTVQWSIFDLSFLNWYFDLIWSEWAIYIMWFKEWIKYIKNFLKPWGVVALSEIVWTQDNIPSELRTFWEGWYPQIDNIKNKIKLLEDNGYKILWNFTLWEDAWENYYKSIENKISQIISKYPSNPELLEAVEWEKKEIELYRKYKDYYSYEFFVAKI